MARALHQVGVHKRHKVVLRATIKSAANLQGGQKGRIVAGESSRGHCLRGEGKLEEHGEDCVGCTQGIAGVIKPDDCLGGLGELSGAGEAFCEDAQNGSAGKQQREVANEVVQLSSVGEVQFGIFVRPETRWSSP